MSKVKQPTRTTKTNQKLVLFPEQSLHEESPLLEPITCQNKGRVTAYCTASSYNLVQLREFIEHRRKTLEIHTKRLDEVLHTPFFSGLVNTLSLQAVTAESDPLLQNEAGHPVNDGPLVDCLGAEDYGDVFLFDYGVMVLWGLSEHQEQSLIQELAKFSVEPLDPSDHEVELLTYQYTDSATPRIFDDCLTIRVNQVMTKLTISHALAQSVKLSVFEERINSAIYSMQKIPVHMAKTGKVPLPRNVIMKKIGQLFVMRIHVNLVSNVLDTPDIFWSEVGYEPLYVATRAYLEISKRVEVLNQRTGVISDLLEMLKDHLTSRQSEFLEWVIIVLIFIEIIVGIVMIIVETQK